MPRLGLASLHVVRGAAPDDDPELMDEYYAGLPEEDGGAVTTKPPPKPKGLPGNRSFSIGPPNAGWLMGGKEFPEVGPHHRVLNGTARRGWNWGTDRLVQVLTEGATAVGERYGGAPLRIGNLSRRGGGKIRPSVSHQSGRDADIGIYATNLDDESVDAPGFPKFNGADGLLDTTGRYLFDVPRNWTFVSALLKSEKARIQWIFLDDPLKVALLDYAVRTRASHKLIARAEKVIMRPRNSSPHANHFHIRIFCTDGDLEYGCKDYGPEWEWVKQQREVNRAILEDRVDRIMRGEVTLDLRADSPSIIINGTEVAEPGMPAAIPSTPKPPRGRSPEDLPDPPTDIEFRVQ
jgi:penicillin-insensitive murein endopeptidase